MEKKEKDQVVEQLQSQEKELKKEMSAKQRQDQKLGNAIAAAIRRAREEAMREAKKKAAADAAANAATVATPAKTDPAKNSGYSANAGAMPATVKPAIKTCCPVVFNTTADIALSGNFEKDKGHLPWPIASGTIAMRLVRMNISKGLSIITRELPLKAAPGSSVTAVFDGLSKVYLMLEM